MRAGVMVILPFILMKNGAVADGKLLLGLFNYRTRRIMRSASFYWLTSLLYAVYVSVAGAERSYSWEEIPSLKWFAPYLWKPCLGWLRLGSRITSDAVELQAV